MAYQLAKLWCMYICKLVQQKRLLLVQNHYLYFMFMIDKFNIPSMSGTGPLNARMARSQYFVT